MSYCIKLARILIFLFGAIPCFAFSTANDAMATGESPFVFRSKTWRDYENRKDSAQALVEKAFLIGMTREHVHKLLGSPDSPYSIIPEPQPRQASTELYGFEKVPSCTQARPCLEIDFEQDCVKSAFVTDVSSWVHRQLAEENNIALRSQQNLDPHARDIFARLACSEICTGMIKEGLKHERQAMELYSANDPGGVLGYSDNMLIAALIQSGHADDAKNLLLEAIETAKIKAGPKSVATQSQMADLFSFYVTQGLFADALRTLDQVLNFDLSPIKKTFPFNGPDQPPGQVFASATNSSAGMKPRTAEQVINRVRRTLTNIEPQEPSFAATARSKIAERENSSHSSN